MCRIKLKLLRIKWTQMISTAEMQCYTNAQTNKDQM
jgi:hypothetical protein